MHSLWMGVSRPNSKAMLLRKPLRGTCSVDFQCCKSPSTTRRRKHERWSNFKDVPKKRLKSGYSTEPLLGVSVLVAMTNIRAIRYRELALKESDEDRARLLNLLADEAERGVLVTTNGVGRLPEKTSSQYHAVFRAMSNAAWYVGS